MGVSQSIKDKEAMLGDSCLVKNDQLACDDLFKMFLKENDSEKILLLSDYLCLADGYHDSNLQYFYCFTAAEFYLKEKGDTEKAIPRYKVSCALSDLSKDSLSNQVHAASCVLVAAMEQDMNKFKKVFVDVAPKCTEAYCLYNLAYALALVARHKESIEYIEQAVKGGIRSKKSIGYFNKFPKIRKNSKFKHIYLNLTE